MDWRPPPWEWIGAGLLVASVLTALGLWVYAVTSGPC